MIGQYGGGACLGRALRRSRGVLVLQAVEVYVRDLCVDPVALHVVRRLQRRAHGALERDLRPRRVRPSRAGGRSARQRCVKSKQKYKVSNWSDYNKSLKNRSNIDIWLSQNLIKHWYYEERIYDGTGSSD